MVQGLYVTPDDRFVYLQDWESAHLIKLDANTDRVLKIFDSSDGFVMPHGGFVAGSLRYPLFLFPKSSFT